MILIISTTVVNYGVSTIVAIWQYTPPFVFVTMIFIIPFDTTSIKPTRASSLFSNAVGSPWPLDTTFTMKCLHTVIETNVTANMDSHFMFDSPALSVFVSVIFCILVTPTTVPTTRAPPPCHWQSICAIWPLSAKFDFKYWIYMNKVTLIFVSIEYYRCCFHFIYLYFS